MKHLTPDEVCERADIRWLNRESSLRWYLNKLTSAGLVVVDATDTPNEMRLVGYVRCSTGKFDPVIDRYHGPVYAPGIANASPRVSAGGSPGGSGTVTQETSADDDDPPHSTRRMRMWDEPPEPGFFPGPVVDGQPTWGADYSDIPRPRNAWQWTVNMGDWFSAEVAPMAGEPYWVLVRRTPQPATEQVPWHKARDRRHPTDGRIESVWHRYDGRRYKTEIGRTHNVPVSGMVEVLAEEDRAQ